ncbi:hypothetical protein [Thiohalomonas denitrificans]|uniref:Uncharacterized protein n=1 Tax=Thiohalomonas denitrificans TaxID=415747 RepID=A0A1G5QF58_9GAMM|nr:hypothetical protein [Thiohalomonas denitrificans]SCZ60236.1 hypothetical protein SAMN03097708_02013 [Thiohalomonas denitrificans]
MKRTPGGRSDSENGEERISNVYLEREGRNRIDQVLSTVEDAPWSISLVQLAWTAGPVTYIAAQGGYYLGYNEFLPLDRMAFFVGYTVIAGIIGILTKVVYDTHAKRKKRRQDEALTTVIDRLPELIFAVRNLALEQLPPDQRKREAAWHLLKEFELGPVSLATAVEDLTGDNHLAETAQRAEIYRRNGMRIRAQDLLDEEWPLISAVLDELHTSAPAMEATLRGRLEGHGPTIKMGVPRDEHFIERILAAIAEDNLALMTLYDVDEILILAFELLSGREIPVLAFNYRGSWRLARATDNLELARTHYRLAQARGYSRLKALIGYLTERHTELAEAVAGQPTPVLLEKAQQTFDALRDEIYELRVDVANGKISQLPTLQEKTETLSTGLELYRAIRDAYRAQGRRHAALIRARQRWDYLSNRRPDSATALRTGRGHYGLRIAERIIKLDDEDKLKVAEALAKPLRSLDLRREPRTVVRAQTGFRTLTVEAAKDLTVEVALILQRFINIGSPEAQRAINGSNASLLANIEPGMSAASKAAIGAAVAKEVRADTGRAAEQLAWALVRHYRIELTDEAIDFLHKTYGANIETLKVLAGTTEPMPSIPISQLRTRPPSIPPLEESWTRQINRARRLLERHNFHI